MSILLDLQRLVWRYTEREERLTQRENERTEIAQMGERFHLYEQRERDRQTLQEARDLLLSIVSVALKIVEP